MEHTSLPSEPKNRSTTRLYRYMIPFSPAGAMDQLENVADFCSRGPVIADDSGRIKPDIIALGVDDLSALPDGAYGSNSGTSMAGLQATGAVALKARYQTPRLVMEFWMCMGR